MVFYMLSGVLLIFTTSIAWLPDDDPNDIKEKTLNIGKIIFERKILFLFIFGTATSFSLSYIFALIANHLYNTFGNS